MKISSKPTFLAALLLLFPPLLLADDLTNNFKANLNQNALDELTEDLGALMGTGSFHQGKALGFPIGFDVGAHVGVVGVGDNNVILKDDGSSAKAVWGQAEVGLPGKINIIGRIGEYEDADMIGGGLRYGIFTPSLPGLPAVSVSALYGQMEHTFFDLETITINAVVSFDLPFIRPYFGGGYDSSKLEPTATARAGTTAPASLEGDADGVRGEVGINLSVFPFTYINIGVGMANSEELYHLGAGVTF